MTHVFVAPHPDDVALSCGGLIASLRELGQNVTILTVFSGSGAHGRALTPYQREALGFGSKALWPVTEAFNRATPVGGPPVRCLGRPGAAVGRRRRIGSTRPRPTPTPRPSGSGSARRGTAGRASATSRWPARPVIDDVPTQGAVLTDELVEAAAAGEVDGHAAALEDERFAYFAEASIVFLDLPDAVFRGYEGDEQLLGAPRAGRRPRRSRSSAARSPGSSRRRSTSRSGSAATSTTSSCRDVGVALLAEPPDAG